MADRRRSKLNEALGYTARRHQITGENEKRDSKKRIAVQHAERPLHHDLQRERAAAEYQRKQRGKAHAVCDRSADQEKNDKRNKKNDQHGSSPPNGCFRMYFS